MAVVGRFDEAERAAFPGLGPLKAGNLLRLDQEPDGACLPRRAADQLLFRQRQEHLVDRGWRSPKEALQIGLSRGLAEHDRVVVDKG